MACREGHGGATRVPVCGRRIMVNAVAFQATDEGSIPSARSTSKIQQAQCGCSLTSVAAAWPVVSAALLPWLAVAIRRTTLLTLGPAALTRLITARLRSPPLFETAAWPRTAWPGILARPGAVGLLITVGRAALSITEKPTAGSPWPVAIGWTGATAIATAAPVEAAMGRQPAAIRVGAFKAVPHARTRAMPAVSAIVVAPAPEFRSIEVFGLITVDHLDRVAFGVVETVWPGIGLAIDGRRIGCWIGRRNTATKRQTSE